MNNNTDNNKPPRPTMDRHFAREDRREARIGKPLPCATPEVLHLTAAVLDQRDVRPHHDTMTFSESIHLAAVDTGRTREDYLAVHPALLLLEARSWAEHAIDGASESSEATHDAITRLIRHGETMHADNHLSIVAALRDAPPNASTLDTLTAAEHARAAQNPATERHFAGLLAEQANRRARVEAVLQATRPPVDPWSTSASIHVRADDPWSRPSAPRTTHHQPSRGIER